MRVSSDIMRWHDIYKTLIYIRSSTSEFLGFMLGAPRNPLPQHGVKLFDWLIAWEKLLTINTVKERICVLRGDDQKGTKNCRRNSFSPSSPCLERVQEHEKLLIFHKTFFFSSHWCCCASLSSSPSRSPFVVTDKFECVLKFSLQSACFVVTTKWLFFIAFHAPRSIPQTSVAFTHPSIF